MIELLNFKNVTGQTVQFNTTTLPLTDFNVDVEHRRTERQKQQRHGIWPSFTLLGRMLIHIEGDILYNTSTEYITARLDMLDKLYPFNYERNPTARKMGTLFLQYTGQPVFETDVALDGYPEIPMQALYPGTTPYLITFVSFTPYMLKNGLPVNI
jgi:hypothetical protein